MIAKRIKRKTLSSDFARLSRYVVDARGQVDPLSWTRTADYILDTREGGAKVGGVRITNCAADDPAMAAIEILATQGKNTRSKGDRSYHLVFSFPPGETPPLPVLHAIEDALCAAIGMADHQRISAVHCDTDHLHVHVAINKVHPTTFRNVEPFYDKDRLMQACERLEGLHGLQRTHHGDRTRSHSPKRKKNDERHDRNAGDGRRDSRNDARLRELYRHAIAEAPAAKSLHSVRNLSGCGLVQNARRLAMLLPGNAPGVVVEGRATGAAVVRRPGDGADRVLQGGLTSGAAADMEAHTGQESLQGWIVRNASPALFNATDWDEFHRTLAEHGLRARTRGAGLVLTTADGQIGVKGSDIARGLSLTALERRFGRFAEARQSALSVPVLMRYESRPRQAGAESLFEQFTRERNAAMANRKEGQRTLRDAHARYAAELATYHAARRQSIRESGMRGVDRKFAYKQLAEERQTDWGQRQALLKAQRERLVNTNPLPVWQAWLSTRAAGGDAEALQALRSLEKRRDNFVGRWLRAADAEAARTVVREGASPRADKRGQLHYRVGDGGAVVDSREGVRVTNVTDAASFFALTLAADKYAGQRLIVDGSDAFRRDVARIAGEKGLDIRFADDTLDALRIASRAPAIVAADVQPPVSAIATFVAARNAQRERVDSILLHREWSEADAGEATYRGRRTLADGTQALLLERQGVMLAMSVTRAQAAKAAAWAVGAQVRTDARGRFISQTQRGPRR